ncbi:MAG: hypothetical protein JNK21_11495 [Rhodospirillaceae bacterium]|nr:hypothetical protein [Rhodospirillaceae bacterium]
MTDDIRSAWQNQSTSGASMQILTEVMKKTGVFRRKIIRRNWVEYIAGAFVITIFGFYIYRIDSVLADIGSALTIAATIFVMHYLRKRGSPGTPPTEGTLTEMIAFHRHELARQRDLVRNVMWWYLVPFVPGVFFFVMGTANLAALSLSIRIPVILAIFVGVWLLNQYGARRLQKQIDALEHISA